MASKPTADEIRALLEGYCAADSTHLSDTWVENMRDNFVCVWLAEKFGFSITGEESVTEYLDGTGKDILFLNNKNALSLTRIEYVVSNDYSQDIDLTAYLLIPKEGIVKAIKAVSYLGSSRAGFPKGKKNIKVTYTKGYDADDLPLAIKQGIMYFTAEKMLAFLEGRGGGGDMSTQGFSKSYGADGKWTNIRNMLARMGWAMINDYFTSTQGS